MLEYLTVLLLVIFCHCFKRHTYGTVSIDLQMLRAFLCRVENVVVYSHVLLFALTVEFQFTMWKQRWLTVFCFGWKHSNGWFQSCNMFRFCQFAYKLLCHLVSECVPHNHSHFLLYRLYLLIIEIVLAQQMDLVHSSSFFQTSDPLQINSVAKLAVVLVKTTFHLLYCVKQLACWIYTKVSFVRQTVVLVNKTIIRFISHYILIGCIER